MRVRRALFAASIVAAAANVLSGCTQSYSEVRYEFQPYEPSQWNTEAGSVKIETNLIEATPGIFKAQEYECHQGRRSESNIVESYLDPDDMVDVTLVPAGSLFYEVKISNNTGHIARFDKAAVTLTDPQDNVYDAMSADRLKALLYIDRHQACPMSPQLAVKFEDLALIDRRNELMPGRSVSRYAVFKPKDLKMPGIWRLHVYDMPVTIDQAGEKREVVTLGTQVVLRKLVDVFNRKSFFSTEFEKTTKDITFGGTVDKAVDEATAEKEARDGAK